jgi:hypothetical protein
VKPETRTVTQLFELDVRYVVPLYQRPYVWQEESQWQPLWDDILTLLEHQETGNGQHYSHFLGAIVLEQETLAPGEIPIFTVIDGQQRLTTLQILLAAASNVAMEEGAMNDGEIIRDLVANDQKKASGVALFKVWPTNANRSAFEAVLGDGGPPEDRPDDPDNRIDEAYAFFTRQVREWAAEVEGEDRVKRLRLLRITLCDLLKVVSITLEADDNAQVIFETLNARGTPLLALDLVKNAVFLEARRQDIETDGLYEQVWKPEFDALEMDRYWRALRRQGRLNRPVAELFLMHWLAMTLRRVVPATELFSTFRARVLGASPPPQMAELIAELCRDAKIMRSFDNPPPGSVVATYYERLAPLDTSTVIPLVLFLFREPSVSPERRRRALRILESWLIRRLLMSLTAKNYNQQIPVILGRVADAPQAADEVILEELRTGVGQISRWPTDDELRSRLTNQNLYGWVRQDRIAMALAAVEETLYTNKVEAIAVPKRLSIEHVMPQSWEEKWPLSRDLVGEEREAAEAARNERIHRLGNLTIVTQPLNSSLSNSPWASKQKGLTKNSKLLLNARLIDEHPDVFDEAAIDARGTWLADRIISIWPGPDSWDQAAPAI